MNKLDIGGAMNALKQGKKVRRTHWSNKSFLWLKPEAIIKASWCKDLILKQIIEKQGIVSSLDDIDDKSAKSILALDVICKLIETVPGEYAILSGWMASQMDLLATDWEIIE